ncbi:PDDEXK nuclease domain-containing protein [Pseudomonas cichorii]|uniref:PDDEXK nuclease domain-containing protein n=1 Tax=Pseudomonas cichorii TaxID=36746 RepID=UPI001C8A2F8F|nr:PDDEXK nuclease domain-containing protein [Pseudomonas cichorii]MBX8517767.1 PDDEXK nuclease domain-containing protein [Pseudomonas cichorii]
MSEPATPSPLADERFDEVLALIYNARQQVMQAVNSRLIELYWQVGAYISRKLEQAEWGDAVVSQLADHLAQTQPGLRGFTRSNLFRMRQFYEVYRAEEKVAPLVRQLSWTHNLIIFSQSKRPEEREFYLRMAVQEKWSKRELERQFKAALFERNVTQPAKASAVLNQSHPAALEVFRDAYMVEFLGLPGGHAESDLHKGLLVRLKDFLPELGRDFCFVGSEYPLQVGGRDFALDLLFFHRGLNCLVAIELKVGRFEPEYLGKLDFYLEALDRNERKPHENPAIGVLLCASKDDEVVEYALNRSLSPALIAEYQTRLPDKQLLQAKLHEFYVMNTAQ